MHNSSNFRLYNDTVSGFQLRSFLLFDHIWPMCSVIAISEKYTVHSNGLTDDQEMCHLPSGKSVPNQ